MAVEDLVRANKDVPARALTRQFKMNVHITKERLPNTITSYVALTKVKPAGHDAAWYVRCMVAERKTPTIGSMLVSNSKPNVLCVTSTAEGAQPPNPFSLTCTYDSASDRKSLRSTWTTRTGIPNESGFYPIISRSKSENEWYKCRQVPKFEYLRGSTGDEGGNGRLKLKR